MSFAVVFGTTFALITGVGLVAAQVNQKIQLADGTVYFAQPPDLVNESNIPSPSTHKDATPLAEKSIQKIATFVTVRILTNLGAGSGVIISRQGQTYTVLTNAHVVQDSPGDHYTVLTTDGQLHPAQLRRFSPQDATPSPQSGDLDLAMVQFTSDQVYRVVQMGDSKALAVGDSVYSAGFPNWQLTDSHTVNNTRDWGLGAFRFTTGKVAMLSALSLVGGYQLGYTNDIQSGMSGGPVLDQNSLLVGINGRLKHPLQGIRVFTFTDGTVPSEELFHQMAALSWAIPIATFQQLSQGNPTLLLSSNKTYESFEAITSLDSGNSDGAVGNYSADTSDIILNTKRD